MSSSVNHDQGVELYRSLSSLEPGTHEYFDRILTIIALCQNEVVAFRGNEFDTRVLVLLADCYLLIANENQDNQVFDYCVISCYASIAHWRHKYYKRFSKIGFVGSRFYDRIEKQMPQLMVNLSPRTKAMLNEVSVDPVSNSHFTKAVDPASTPYLRRLMVAEYGNRVAEKLQGQGKHAEAIIIYSRSIEQLPNHTTSLFGRGSAYFESSQLDLALDDLTKAAIIDPSNAFVRALRAQVLFELGQRSAALVEIDQALIVQPLNQQFLALKRLFSMGGIQ